MAEVHYWITGEERLYYDEIVPMFQVWGDLGHLLAKRYILDVGDGYMLMDSVDTEVADVTGEPKRIKKWL